MEKEQRNFLQRLRQFSINSNKQKKKSSDNRNDENQMQMNNSPVISEQENGNCASTRKSFRKNMKKMQARVKNYVFKQNGTQQTSSDVPSSSNTEAESPVASNINEEVEYDTVSNTRCFPAISDQISGLIKSHWYWGPLSRSEAEEKLRDTLDGTFLVRDSASNDYLFSVSFRALGKTLHVRVDHSFGSYSLFDCLGNLSMCDLIENALKKSESGVYCYSEGPSNEVPNYPIRFLTPLSRCTTVPTLKHRCRFVIRQCINLNDISKLPLPSSLKGYLQEASYF